MVGAEPAPPDGVPAPERANGAAIARSTLFPSTPCHSARVCQGSFENVTGSPVSAPTRIGSALSCSRADPARRHRARCDESAQFRRLFGGQLGVQVGVDDRFLL